MRKKLHKKFHNVDLLPIIPKNIKPIQAIFFVSFILSLPCTAYADSLILRGGGGENIFNYSVTPSGGSPVKIATEVYSAKNIGATWFYQDDKYIDLANSSGKGEMNTSGSYSTSESSLIFGYNNFSDNNYYVGLKTFANNISDPSIGDLQFSGSVLAIGGGWMWKSALGFFGINMGVGFGGGQTNLPNSSVASITALSIGATYTYPISPLYGVNLDLKYNNYTYSMTDNLNSSSFNIDQSQLKFGLNGYVRF